ncbi:MAG: proline--tRNA ligase, partial [Bacteroidia bacterium]|nr:proline--tRNA ligase [Bacteroidia bacterium]
MRVSQLLGTTLRETAREAELVSHDLLLRAGYIRQLATGIFSQLHLGLRSLEKIERVIREEMDAIGGVEISMPVVHPAELWEKTGRYDAIDDSLVRFSDRSDRRLVLAMTHEEVVASLAASEVSSYRQLPKLIYQIQTKFRDELRSRGGLIRVREFRMKDSYSLDSSWEGMEKQYKAHYDAYFQIMKRLGLPVVAVLSDVGMMGGRIAHEFMYLTPIGEDTIFIDEANNYFANR